MPAKESERAKKGSSPNTTGSMFPCVNRLGDDQGSSEGPAPPSPVDEAISSDATDYSAEEQGAGMEDFEAEESADSDSGPYTASKMQTIDAETFAVMEEKKWKKILDKLLSVILFLAKNNLAFRIHEEDESSVGKGNFLETVEMLSKFDAVLKEHVMSFKRGTCKLKASVSYLTLQTQNEFISALASHVKERLVSDIKSANYFGIIFDSITDISYTDQMSEVIRYVKISNRKVEVKEVFLGFFPLRGKNAADLSSDILKNLDRDGLDIKMCRAQGYDNAAAMTRTHGGVQAILKEKNKKAIFNGCVDHSLNLCGLHSFSEHASSLTFFATLERIFSFFAANPDRWGVLTDHTGVSLERPSTTRWSVHHAAVRLVKEKFDALVTALEALCEPHRDWATRGEAEGLLPDVCDFTFLGYLHLWCDVLQEVDLAQQYLQTKGLTLDKVAIKLEALRLSLHEQRSHLVEHAIERALLKADEYEIPVNRRPTFKNGLQGEQARNAGLTPEEAIKEDMLDCIDRFHSELQVRSRATEELAAMFEAVQVKSLMSATEDELKVSIPKMTAFYDEVSESELLMEIPRLRRHLKAAGFELEKAKDWAVLDVLRFIVEWDFVQSLATLSLSLRLFLTVCVSVASCERNFSKLELIKDYLHSTIEQSSDLAILSVESELAGSIDFYEVVNRFAAFKARKGKF